MPAARAGALAALETTAAPAKEDCEGGVTRRGRIRQSWRFVAGFAIGVGISFVD
jgi:hypothetical protein